MKVRGGIVTFKHKRGYYRLRHLQKLQAVGVEVKVKKDRAMPSVSFFFLCCFTSALLIVIFHGRAQFHFHVLSSARV